jgi:hypothetical protein
LLLREFQRRAHTYLKTNDVPQGDVVEWLALMQHFGAPTRLLDVTASPYVASYFAVEGLAEQQHDGAVWAFDRWWLYESAGALILDTPEKRSAAEEEIQKDPELKDLPLLYVPAMRASLITSEAWLDNPATMVLPAAPHKLTQRLSIQQGEFLIPRDVNVGFMANLAAHKPKAGCLIKFIIPAEGKAYALGQLRLMNITRASLFPGLEGFAQSFQQLLIKESEKAKSVRALRAAIERLSGHGGQPYISDTPLPLKSEAEPKQSDE